MKPPPPTERQTQRAILKMAGVAFPRVLIHHSPNGAHLSGDPRARFMQMGALKGDGLKSGWPDLICLWAGGVAFIEVKRPGKENSVSDDQAAMHDKLRAIGYPVAVVSSTLQAFDFLKGEGAPTNIGEWRE